MYVDLLSPVHKDNIHIVNTNLFMYGSTTYDGISFVAMIVLHEYFFFQQCIVME